MSVRHGELAARIERCRRSVATRQLAGRAALVAAVAGAALSALALAFALFPWTLLPLLWDLTVAAAALALAGVALDTLVLRPVSLEQTARMLERQADDPHPLLALALQIPPGREGVSGPLAREVERRALESLNRYPASVRGVYPRQRTLQLAAGLVLFAASSLLLTPRIASYWDLPFAGQAGTVRVEPGSIAVARGTSVALALHPMGRPAPSCWLTVRALDGSWRTAQVLRPDSSGAFRFTTSPLTRSVVYGFSLAGRDRAADTITVVPPPSLYAFSVALEPPAYTGQPARHLPDGQGNFSAPSGTRAVFSVASHWPLAAAWLIFGSDTLALAVDKGAAGGALTVRRSGPYTLRLRDTLGQTSDSLPSFYLEAVADNPPLVHFGAPGMNRALTTAMRESLVVDAADDYGIRSLAVEYRMSGSGAVSGRHAPEVKGAPPAVRALIDWNLAPLGLYPGDTVFYWAVAEDNKPGSAPGRSVSDTFWLRVPGFEEISERIAAGGERAERSMQDVRERQQDLNSRLEDMVRACQPGRRELSWEQKQVLSDVQRQIESQRDSLRAAVENLREAVEALREQGLESEELARKMEDVRKAVEDLVKQYGDSLLFDTKDNRREVTAEDMAQALRKMQEMLPQLEQRLDQALRYLEALRRDQELAALAQRFARMAERQAQVAAMADSAQQRRREQELLQGIGELSRDTRRRMEPGDEQLLKPGDVPSLADVDSISQELQNMQSSSAGQCQARMQRMSSALASAGQQIESRMSSAMMRRMAEDRERMLALAHDALTLADWQEEQAGAAERSTDLASLVRAQQALREALATGMRSLDSLSMVPPQALQEIVRGFDGAARAMARAEQTLAAGGAAPAMAEAIAGLNGAAQALLDAGGGMDGQCGGAGGAGQGFMGMMRRLSGQQAAINAATGELLRQMLAGKQPGGMREGGDGESSADAREEARRAQQALADQLKKLAEQYGDKAGPGGAERMKELQEEAKRLARMLENPTEELRERQDRFLARMLQTTLSLHREEEGKEERQSRSATMVFGPQQESGPLRRFADTDAYYRLRRQAFHGNVPFEYRPAVKAYFDSLGVLYLAPGQ